MTSSDYIEIAGLLLGLYALGFAAGYMVALFKRFTEQV